MKRIHHILSATVIGSLLLTAEASAQLGTNFTYQGRLYRQGQPANGTFDLLFELYADPGGAPFGDDCKNDVVVTNGLFTVELDFGQGAFVPEKRYLRMSVRPETAATSCSTGTGYTALEPPLELMSAPQSRFESGGQYSTVGDGLNNFITGEFSVIGGGREHTITGTDATVSGGAANTASGNSTVGGGSQNNASNGGTVGGGGGNDATGLNSTVPGGIENEATGDYSFAAGRRAKAIHAGTFVWGDSTDADFSSFAPNTFLVRATDGSSFTANGGTPAFVVSQQGAGDAIVVMQSGDDAMSISGNTDYGVYTGSPVAQIALLVETANAAGEWALSTSDKISAANVTARSMSIVAVADDDAPIAPGDIVVASGFELAEPGRHVERVRVRRATGRSGEGIVGVVEAVVVSELAPGKESEGVYVDRLKTDRMAIRGEQVSLVIAGVAHVPADSSRGAIITGQRLTAGADGMARALQTRDIDGMVVAEDAPVVGVALGPVDETTGKVPVMVLPR